jgi:antitoxin component YwqK of YwqJK toxin-antitoxin module
VFICFILSAAAARAEIVGVQTGAGAGFYQGTTKVASWKFLPDGSVEAEGAAINGVVKMYAGEGTNRRFAMYNIKDNVIQDGTYLWAYKSGAPAGNVTYNNGKFEGPFSLMFRSGKLSKQGTYKDGKKHGVYRLYYDKGSLAQEGNYNYGIRQGEFKLYYPGGALKEKITFVNDRRDGPYQQLYESGTIKVEGQYRNNLKDGTFQKYFESGEDAGTQVYKKGALVSGDSDYENDADTPDVTE